MAKLVNREEICEALKIDEDRLDDLLESRRDFPYLIYNEGTEDEEMKFPLEEVLATVKILKKRKKKAAPEPKPKPEPPAVDVFAEPESKPKETTKK